VLDPEVKDARLQAWADYCNWNDVLAIIRKLYPHRKFVDDIPTPKSLSMTTDFSQLLALLKKWAHQDGWRSLEEMVADNMKNIVDWYPQSLFDPGTSICIEVICMPMWPLPNDNYLVQFYIWHLAL